MENTIEIKEGEEIRTETKEATEMNNNIRRETIESKDMSSVAAISEAGADEGIEVIVEATRRISESTRVRQGKQTAKKEGSTRGIREAKKDPRGTNRPRQGTMSHRFKRSLMRLIKWLLRQEPQQPDSMSHKR